MQRRATDLTPGIGNGIYEEGHMITHSGILFNLLDPNPADILIEDIAIHLSRIARWNGGTHQFYSVAEHCCRCCDAAEDEYKLLLLLHDSEEAYWGDTISTVKSILKRIAPEIPRKMTELRKIILEKFGAPTGIPALNKMKAIDSIELHLDFDRLIIKRDRACWSPWKAEGEFLKRFYELTNP